ncbi:MAG: hypothetical protein ACK5HP_00045 [Bacilli bacterium]
MNLHNFEKVYENSSKISIRVYVILRIAIIVCLVRELFLQNYNNALLCVLSLILFLIPIFIKDKFKINMPTAIETTIFCFIFSAEILGEISNFYGNIYIWDSILHTINGFLCAAVGFNLINLLNNKIKDLSLTPLFVAIFAFCFSMTIGVCWEFIEFSLDKYIFADSQKDRIVQTISTVELDPIQDNNVVVIKNINHTIIYDKDNNELATINGGYLELGIIDTMKDLFVNLIGAIVFSIMGYLYITDSKKYNFAEKFKIKKV